MKKGWGGGYLKSGWKYSFDTDILVLMTYLVNALSLSVALGPLIFKKHALKPLNLQHYFNYILQPFCDIAAPPVGFIIRTNILLFKGISLNADFYFYF